MSRLNAYIIIFFLFTGAARGMHSPPEMFELPNGFRVVCSGVEGTGVVSLGIWAGAGSVHEKDEQAGIAHMLEHMLFKGSLKYPPRSAERIIESLGGRLNGASSFEYTCYYVSIPSEHFFPALDILSDMVKNPLFCPEEFTREKQVVLREVAQREDDPLQRSARLFYQAAFQGHYYGRPVIGFRETIEALDIEDLRKFHEERYTPCSLVLVAAGDIRADRVLKGAVKHFGSLEPGPGAPYVPPSPSRERSEYLERADIKSAYIWLGARGPEASFEKINRAAALSLVMSILGRGRSSTLYRSLRDDRNIVNSISAGFPFMTRGGPVFIRAVCEPGRRGEVLEEIFAELRAFLAEGPSPGEFERARTLALSDMAFGFESSADVIRTYGAYASTGNMDFLLNYADALANLELDDLKAAANRYLAPGGFAVSELLPFEEKK